MNSSALKTMVIAAICSLPLVLAPKASAIQFSTPTGTVTGDGPVNATVNLTISGGSVTLTLINNLQNPTSAGQLISGISFDITGATGSGTLSSVNSGNVTTISLGGAYTPGVSSSLTHWIPTESGTTINLTTLTGGKPNIMIIGPDNKGNLNPALGGLYSAANSSIGNFNPSVLGSATFTITVPGVSSGSRISDVTFQFGTGPDSFVGVPDNGATLVLLGLGLTCVGVFRSRFAKAA